MKAAGVFTLIFLALIVALLWASSKTAEQRQPYRGTITTPK